MFEKQIDVLRGEKPRRPVRPSDWTDSCPEILLVE